MNPIETDATETDPAEFKTIQLLRETTRDTEYEGRLYLVGGLLRDRALGLPPTNDLDVVLEGDALELARYLHARGVAQHFPVLYPRFGTAMIHVEEGNGGKVELVSARAESYRPDSRKPDVRGSGLHDDAFRRDFTINTLLENLHTGEMLDLTGRAFADIEAGIIRTPLEPGVTFFDDPLRMLRAIRFAARFGFRIVPDVWEAIRAEAGRLAPPTIAFERIRDEFVKIVALPGRAARVGLRLLLESNLLERFLPEMLPMVGCQQGSWHPYDVWEHTLYAVESLADHTAVPVRLALLWHDLGKPSTRSEADGVIRFHGHAARGAEMAHSMMLRLKFSSEEIRDATTLVQMHMRLGEYRPAWTDSAVRRLIRDCGDYLDDLFEVTRCDLSALRVPEGEAVDLAALRARIGSLNAISNAAHVVSPLTGNAVISLLGASPGRMIGEAKDYLVNQVLDGHLAEFDTIGAERLLRAWWLRRTG